MGSNAKSVCEASTFTIIFKSYAKSLHSYLYYKTGNHSLSADLTQEAFAKLWQNCKSVVYETAKGYVFKTANNLLINEYKHQQVVFKFENKSHTEVMKESPEFLLEEKELKIALEKAIADLPEPQRIVFLLSRIDKKTYKEIAEMLDLSRQAVEKRMYKALDQLRKITKNIK